MSGISKSQFSLELGVPLGLGVSLSTMRRRIHDTVDRTIFLRRYREEVALRRLAIESALVTQPDSLLDLAVDQIRRGIAAIPVPVTSISWSDAPDLGLVAWLRIFEGVFSGGIALAVIWRGRDRAATGLALFATSGSRKNS